MSNPKKDDAADLAGGRHREHKGKWSKRQCNVGAQATQRKPDRRAAARALAQLKALFGPPVVHRRGRP